MPFTTDQPLKNIVTSRPFLSLGLIAAGAVLPLPVRAELIGHWAFDEGTGTNAADSSAAGNDGVITNATWGTDDVRDNYLIFNGIDSVVDPSVFLPVMELPNDFTWAAWVNSQEPISGTQQNAIIMGNRFDAFGVDFIPRQFIKITPTKFEWQQDGNGTDNLEAPDLDVGTWHHVAVVKNDGGLEYYFDGESIGELGFSQVIGDAAHPFYIGGQTGVASQNEFFNGFIDDVRIYDEALEAAEVLALTDGYNFPPRFTESPIAGEAAEIGKAYTGSLAEFANDPTEGESLTFSKADDDPEWLTVAPDGSLSGTPLAGDVGANQFNIEVTDGNSTISNTLMINVIDTGGPTAPEGVFGSWPLNEGEGSVGFDTSGNNFNASITNAETGGLGENGSVWFDDPERGMVISFEGTNGSGAYATVGAPPFGSLPRLTLEQDFSWSLWARSEQAPNNSIILGNRYSPGGSDFAPREFVKFTTIQFEFHAEGGAAGNLNYDDLLQGVWQHHAVVKTGAMLDYYRDGELLLTTTTAIGLNNEQPLYFGGFGSENWRGYLSDINLFDSAISEADVIALFEGIPVGGNTITITDITIEEGGDISLTWTSRDNTVYSLDYSEDLGVWLNYDDAVPSDGSTTSITLSGNLFPLDSDPAKLFFRVTLAE